MSQPLKPWERARGVGITGSQVTVSPTNYSQTPFLNSSPMAATSTSTTPSSMATTQNQQTPKIPPRPLSSSPSSVNTTTATTTTTPMTTPFSSFGTQGYSGFGSGYGGSSYYGGYSRPYGSFMGGSYGMFNQQQQQQQLLNGTLIGKGVNIMNQVMEGFSRFSYFLGVNFEAMRNFVVSFFGLYKGMSPLFSAANSLTIIKLLKYISKKLYAAFMWLCGVETSATAGKNKKAPLVVRGLLGAAVALSIPYFVTQGLSFFRPSSVVPSAAEAAIKCKAKHDFVALNQGEMSFKQGDSLTLLDASAVPGQNSWANARSSSGASGLVPLNYLTQ